MQNLHQSIQCRVFLLVKNDDRLNLCFIQRSYIILRIFHFVLQLHIKHPDVSQLSDNISDNWHCFKSYYSCLQTYMKNKNAATTASHYIYAMKLFLVCYVSGFFHDVINYSLNIMKTFHWSFSSYAVIYCQLNLFRM